MARASLGDTMKRRLLNCVLLLISCMAGLGAIWCYKLTLTPVPESLGLVLLLMGLGVIGLAYLRREPIHPVAKPSRPFKDIDVSGFIF